MRLSRPSERRGAAITGRMGMLLAAILIFAATSLLFPHSVRDQGSQTPAVPRPQQGHGGPPNVPDLSPPPLTPKRQREILKANYQKMKQEADELAGLAKSLQDELTKSNQNVLSLQIVDKADRIEKLAKKIKTEAVR